jgi:uncharacterized membrane protein YesL
LPEPGFIRKIAEDLWEGSFALFVWTLALWILGVALIVVGEWSILLGLLVAALTLAPGLAGMLVVAGNLARGGFARLGDAWRGTFRLYWRSVALTLPLVLCVAVVLITADIVSAFPGRRELFIAWAFQVGLSMIALILHLYLLPILALHDTSPKQAVRLALALAGKFVWQTAALLALEVGLLAATTLHPMVWLFVPGVWCVIVTNATWRMTRRIRAGLTNS